MADEATTTDRPRAPRTFAGRTAELSTLSSLLEPGPQPLTWVSGIAGIGKSALLREFVNRTEADGGSRILLIDGEITEPTEAGFMRALGDALGRPAPSDTAGAVAALSAIDGTVVIAIDTYERLRLLDDWLRRVFVPALPSNVRLLILGRDAPVAAWHGHPDVDIRQFELDALSAEESTTLLTASGTERDEAVLLGATLRGHPLALRLASSTPRSLDLDPADPHAAFDELARIYLDGLDEELRQTLDAACTTRRVTIPLLQAMVPEGSRATDRFDSLRELPFVSLGRDGLVVHHVLREVVASELRAKNPALYREHRRAAWRLLRGELDEIGESELWRHTADMLYLLGYPAIRNAFFPTAAPRYSVEPAGKADWKAIESIASMAGPAGELDALAAWRSAAPKMFFVARDGAGEVAGFSAVGADSAALRLTANHDPVASAWLDHARRSPVGPDGRIVLIRFMLSAESGERPAAAQSALYLDLKRLYLTLRPALRRMYTCAHEIESMDPILRPLRFEPIGDDVHIDEVPYRIYVNELGAGSVDAWLARLAADDIAPDPPSPLDEELRQLSIDGRRVDLTNLESGVIRCLLADPGNVVRRETLVSEVWGSSWDGDGNALESVISALRRKLGDRASRLSTVRGVGYRLDPLD